MASSGGKTSISYGMNKVFIQDTTVETLVGQYCTRLGLETSDGSSSTPSSMYYRDIVNVGIRLHATLKAKGKCSCSLIRFAPGTPQPVYCVLVPALRDFTRCSTLVLPEEALFQAEENPEKDSKKAKRTARDLRERKLVILLLVDNDTHNRVEIHHYPILEHVGMLEDSGIFISDYNEAVAKEVWSMGVNQSFKMNWKRIDPDASDLQGTASYAARRKALPRWFGLKAVGIWDMAEKYLGYSLGANYSSGCSLERSKSDGTASRASSARSSSNELLVRQEYAPREFDYSIIRDCAIHSALNVSHLIDLVDRVETVGEHEEPIVTPGDATRISSESFHARRHIPSDESSPNEKQILPFVHSVQVFFTKDMATSYAYKYRLPMFAHDKALGGGKKYFSAMGSWLEAYRSIRLQSYEFPPPNMYRPQHGNARDRGDEESLLTFHDSMAFTHECYGGPRRIKLFVDLDAKLKDNPQFLDPEKQCLSMERVNRMTRSTIRWFTNFVNAIFGENTCTPQDWVVLCASHQERGIISRHACLDKPGCYFNSMLDLMSFMYMAEVQQTHEIGTRDPTQDFSEDDSVVQPIHWMIRGEEVLDSMTQRKRLRYVSVVDFSVYNRDSGNIRCVFCAKAEDPERTLNPLLNLFPRADGEDDDWYVVDSHTSHPSTIRDPIEREKHEEDEFAYFLRTLVTCVERTKEQKAARFDGWKMPIGAMGGSLDLEDAKVSGEMISLSKLSRSAEEEEERFNQTTYFLASLPLEAWYATSTIPPGACMERVKEMVRTFRIRAHSDHRKRKALFGALKFGRTMVMETNDPNGIIKTILGYFAGEDKPFSGHNIAPWAVECKGLQAELRITKEGKGKARTTEEKEHEEGLDYWRKKRRTGSHDLRTEDDGSPKEAPITRDNKWDYYLILLRGTKWCPIRERRTEEGNHRTKDRGYLRIYRTGKVEYGCYSAACIEDRKAVFGEKGYYWTLPYLSAQQRKTLWAGV